MNECCLPGGITALACAIANNIKNTEDLFMLAAICGQLGSTLTTIASQRTLIDDKKHIEEPTDDFY